MNATATIGMSWDEETGICEDNGGNECRLSELKSDLENGTLQAMIESWTCEPLEGEAMNDFNALADAIRTAADFNPNNCILEIIRNGCGIVTDDGGNGCAGPAYLDAETLDDMHSSDAFITASVEDFDEDRARYAFESVGVSYDPDTTWIQVELQRNTQGWRQIGWIWK